MKGDLTLAAFLLARLEEDEQVARAATDPNAHFDLIGGTPPEHEFLDRHDPARVLADVEAKRRILDEHLPRQEVTHYRAGRPITEWTCPTCVWIADDETAGGERYRSVEHEPAPCDTLRLLALPFADHPDYDERWRL